MTSLEYAISYELIDHGKRGRLLAPLSFSTPIYEHSVQGAKYTLFPDGLLILHEGFAWDFGSYAIDTPSMVRASAAHDAFCLMTDQGELPWSCRAEADSYFRKLLIEYGTSSLRAWWCYLGVRAYSTLVASRKRVKV